MQHRRCSRTLSVWLGPLASFALSACAPQLQIHTDTATDADFSGYRTYSWIDESALIRSRGSDQPVSALTIRRIETAIRSELSTRGYVYTSEPSLADFTIAFTVGARDKIDIDSFPDTYRGRWWGRWPYYGIDVRTYQEGHLAIDIFDGDSHEPVWFGSGARKVTGADIRDPEAAINEAVRQILSHFPQGQR